MHLSARHLTVLASLVVALNCASRVEAQIYTWRDNAGNLVLSNKQAGSGLRTFAIPETAAIRTTVPAPARAQRFEELIAEHSSRNRVRTDLVRAVMQVESGFNPAALSPKGAMGLMQLMPATARELGVINPFDPAENIRGGVTYLRHLLDRYGDDEQLALAAYNAGPGAVDRYGTTVPPYRETRDYVQRIGRMARSRAIAKPPLKIYKVVEVIDGREVVRYTDSRP